ncbi:hypothetical protein StrepF001_14175 [Streptomyces sp. F001]|uniref:hypothetical protein n=1 Tax=Streptomyces sp. F001 TaxID=1510026 RepID=UPI00101E7BE9|nr:hypothetical protein [Streptomyces sp. F001]RZB18262.1 hypothetical protein StrepF001_14175 [Streptomyces sp. F001]
MGSRIQWQWQEGRGASPHRQKVVVTDKPKESWSPAQLAFRRWSIHVLSCRVCKTDETACERGERLGEEWRQARRSPDR